MKECSNFLNFNQQMGSLLKLILLLFSQVFVFDALGQRPKLMPANQPRLSWSVNLPDTSNMGFFRHYPYISKINMTISNGMVHGVNLKFEQRNYGESYNLNFKGDLLVFQDRYKVPINWVLPVLSTDGIQGDYVGYMYDSYSGSLYPDSIVLRYYENHLLIEDRNRLGGGPIGTSFVGKIEDLADSITLELEKRGYKDPGGAIVLFEGIVERGGELGNLELVFGDSTLFSETVAFCLSTDYPDIRSYKRAMWHPALISGRPIRTRIRIYTELKEGRVYIEPSRGFYGFLPD